MLPLTYFWSPDNDNLPETIFFLPCHLSSVRCRTYNSGDTLSCALCVLTLATPEDVFLVTVTAHFVFKVFSRKFIDKACLTTHVAGYDDLRFILNLP